VLDPQTQMRASKQASGSTRCIARLRTGVVMRSDPNTEPLGSAKRRSRLCRRVSGATGILAVSVALVACGGPSTLDGAKHSTTTAKNSSADRSAQVTALLAYSSCMRAHGIPNFPDPVGSGGIPKQAVVNAERSIDDSQLQTAQNDCRPLLPVGGSLSGRPTQAITAQQQQDYLKVASCMRAHGITDFPDPSFLGGSVEFEGMSQIADFNSPQFARARHICQSLIPAGLPYNSDSSGA
jgi:hypothetical protein